MKICPKAPLTKDWEAWGQGHHMQLASIISAPSIHGTVIPDTRIKEVKAIPGAVWSPEIEQ